MWSKAVWEHRSHRGPPETPVSPRCSPRHRRCGLLLDHIPQVNPIRNCILRISGTLCCGPGSLVHRHPALDRITTLANSASTLSPGDPQPPRCCLMRTTMTCLYAPGLHRCRFIFSHEPAVADYIGTEDSGQLALELFCCHGITSLQPHRTQDRHRTTRGNSSDQAQCGRVKRDECKFEVPGPAS